MAIRDILVKNIRLVNHWKNTHTDFRPKLLVLLYHRVLPEYKENRLNVVVSRAAFEKQVDQLSRKYRIVSLKDANLKPDGDKTRIALTFDDGYWDNYEVAFPILKKKGIPAAFFLAIDYIDGRAGFSDKRLFDKKSGELYDFIKDRFITWDEARMMSEAGMEIGSHGVSHRSLSRMPAEDAKREMSDSKRMIEQNIKTTCGYFSFPFGSRADYNDELIKYAKEIGFKGCMLNVHGYNYACRENFCFKRVVMDEFTDIAHILG